MAAGFRFHRWDDVASDRSLHGIMLP